MPPAATASVPAVTAPTAPAFKLFFTPSPAATPLEKLPTKPDTAATPAVEVTLSRLAA